MMYIVHVYCETSTLPIGSIKFDSIADADAYFDKQASKPGITVTMRAYHTVDPTYLVLNMAT